MTRFFVSLLMGFLSFSALATTTKNITIYNRSDKAIYYGVFVSYHLSSTPGLWEPKSVAPHSSHNLRIDLKDNEGLLDVVVIENTGPIDEITELGTLKPICEFSVIEKEDFSLPLDHVDLNNYANSTLRCRVDLNNRTLTIH